MGQVLQEHCLVTSRDHSSASLLACLDAPTRFDTTLTEWEVGQLMAKLGAPKNIQPHLW